MSTDSAPFQIIGSTESSTPGHVADPSAGIMTSAEIMYLPAELNAPPFGRCNGQLYNTKCWYFMYGNDGCTRPDCRFLHEEVPVSVVFYNVCQPIGMNANAPPFEPAAAPPVDEPPPETTASVEDDNDGAPYVDARIYLKNLPPKHSDKIIRNIVSGVGKVDLIQLLPTKLRNGRRAGFLHMHNEAHARKAIDEINGTWVDDRNKLHAHMQFCEPVDEQDDGLENIGEDLAVAPADAPTLHDATDPPRPILTRPPGLEVTSDPAAEAPTGPLPPAGHDDGFMVIKQRTRRVSFQPDASDDTAHRDANRFATLCCDDDASDEPPITRPPVCAEPVPSPRSNGKKKMSVAQAETIDAELTDAQIAAEMQAVEDEVTRHSKSLQIERDRIIAERVQKQFDTHTSSTARTRPRPMPGLVASDEPSPVSVIAPSVTVPTLDGKPVSAEPEPYSDC